ncbi:MAG: CoA-binding protein [Tepidisphaeraceae bacterium]
MSDACPLPSPLDDAHTAVIKRMLAGKRIAVVGASDDPSRASNHVFEYLLEAGYDVIPVNPNCATVGEVACVPSLSAIKGPVDVVDVFRRSEACADIAREAIEIGAKGIWLQSGIHNDEARQFARDAGIDYIEDRCIMVEHMRRG